MDAQLQYGSSKQLQNRRSQLIIAKKEKVMMMPSSREKARGPQGQTLNGRKRWKPLCIQTTKLERWKKI